jgi:hypothetical protein
MVLPLILLQTKDAKTFFEKYDYSGGQPTR